jgi:hypothetical protein
LALPILAWGIYATIAPQPAANTKVEAVDRVLHPVGAGDRKVEKLKPAITSGAKEQTSETANLSSLKPGGAFSDRNYIMGFTSTQRVRLHQVFGPYMARFMMSKNEQGHFLDLITDRAVAEAKIAAGGSGTLTDEERRSLANIADNFDNSLRQLVTQDKVVGFYEFERQIPYFEELNTLPPLLPISELPTARESELIAEITRQARESAGVPANFSPKYFPTATQSTVDTYLRTREQSDNAAIANLSGKISPTQMTAMLELYKHNREILKADWNLHFARIGSD